MKNKINHQLLFLSISFILIISSCNLPSAPPTEPVTRFEVSPSNPEIGILTFFPDGISGMEEICHINPRLFVKDGIDYYFGEKRIEYGEVYDPETQQPTQGQYSVIPIKSDLTGPDTTIANIKYDMMPETRVYSYEFLEGAEYTQFIKCKNGVLTCGLQMIHPRCNPPDESGPGGG